MITSTGKTRTLTFSGSADEFTKGLRSMFSLRRPSLEVIRAFQARQAKLGFTYAAVGATATVPPAGYTVDHTRIKLGTGETVFLRAKAALARWDHMRLGWIEAWPSEPAIQPGVVVAALARIQGLWSLNAGRMVYVVDEPGPIHRFGFAYGTLPDHVETGEERFLVEWDEASDDVWYDILAFSRPRNPLMRIGTPYIRRVQKRFGRESAAAMVQAVRDNPE
jgi:uncharacterized protein (UPF0548 family)